jgi:hypothetical protein
MFRLSCKRVGKKESFPVASFALKFAEDNSARIATMSAHDRTAKLVKAWRGLSRPEQEKYLRNPMGSLLEKSAYFQR